MKSIVVGSGLPEFLLMACSLSHKSAKNLKQKYKTKIIKMLPEVFNVEVNCTPHL